MLRSELKLLHNYPLDLKIEKTKLRISEWYEHYNGEVYISFSGGKDSTVLLDIVRNKRKDNEMQLNTVLCIQNGRVEKLRNYIKVTTGRDPLAGDEKC